MIKKVVIADFLARALVEPVFARAAGVPRAPDVLLAAYGYTAQIYCDFSGYTDIAIGLALLLGFVFPQNFRSPYRATGFRDFWRRWHMTLSRFLRDDLYIPLGGNRGGRLLTYRNLMITMVLGGLWHGAAWTFVLWGAYHGARARRRACCSADACDCPGWLRWLITFHLIVFGWILFRAQSLATSGTFLSRLAVPGPATLWTAPVLRGDRRSSIGMQLLPAAIRSSACRCGSRSSARRCSAPAWRSSIVFVARDRPEPGRAHRSSTSASEPMPSPVTTAPPRAQPRDDSPTTRRPRDDSLMNRFDRDGLRRFRARDAVLVGAARRRCCSCSFAGHSVLQGRRMR